MHRGTLLTPELMSLWAVASQVPGVGGPCAQAEARRLSRCVACSQEQHDLREVDSGRGFSPWVAAGSWLIRRCFCVAARLHSGRREWPGLVWGPVWLLRIRLGVGPAVPQDCSCQGWELQGRG